jgi:GTP-binding protein
LRIVSARFERASLGPADDPRGAGPDVVFLGRSNVGKSSLINRLLGVEGLARTSGQPGRTQSVNFYRVNDAFWFVDLPGYGYARVPEAVRRAWKPLVEGLLARRARRIAAGVLVVDARRTPTESDLMMRAWLVSRKLRFLLAATKWDKLSGNERVRARAALAAGFGACGLADGPIAVSAHTGHGIAELWRHLDGALESMRDGNT